MNGILRVQTDLYCILYYRSRDQTDHNSDGDHSVISDSELSHSFDIMPDMDLGNSQCSFYNK